jgi:hypothetical protein
MDVDIKKNSLGKMGPFREGRVAWRPYDMPFKARQGNVGTPRRCEGLGEAKEVSPSMPKGLPQNKLKQCRSVLKGA